MTVDPPTPSLRALLAPPGARFLALLFAGALAARLVNLLTLTGDDSLFRFGDSKAYLDGTAAWLKSGSFGGYLAGEVVLPSERMPGYFWILAAIRSLAGPSLPAIALVQCIFDAGTCVMIALLGARIAPETGRLAGLAAAVWPNLIIHANLVLQDTLFLFFFTASLLALAHVARRPVLRLVIVAGLLFGAAFLIRSVVQFLMPVLPLVVLILVLRRGQGVARAMAAAAVFLIAAAVPVAPVLYRNLANFGALAPTTQAGLHALLWTVPLVRADQNGTAFEAESAKMNAKFNARLKAKVLERARMGPFEVDREMRALALQELLATPIWRLAKVWAQGAAVNILAPSILSDGRIRALPRPSFAETRGTGLVSRALRYFFADFGLFQALILMALAGTLIIVLVQLAGLWRLFRQAPFAAVGLTLLIGYFLAISGPTAGPKYRMPIEPAMVILLAAGLRPLFGRRTTARQLPAR